MMKKKNTFSIINTLVYFDILCLHDYPRTNNNLSGFGTCCDASIDLNDRFKSMAHEAETLLYFFYEPLILIHRFHPVSQYISIYL